VGWSVFFLDVLPTKKGGVFLLYLLFWFFGGKSLSLLGGFFKKNYEEEGFLCGCRRREYLSLKVCL